MSKMTERMHTGDLYQSMTGSITLRIGKLTGKRCKA